MIMRCSDLMIINYDNALLGSNDNKLLINRFHINTFSSCQKNLKENYAQFRKRHFCDGSSDIFRRTPNGRPGGSVAPTPAKDFTTFGPSPFSYGSGVSSVAFSSALDRSSTSMTANQNQSKADCFGWRI